MNTITSLTSVSFASRQRSPTRSQSYSTKTRPLLSEHQQTDSNHIDYKFISPLLNPYIVTSSSPVSFLPSTASFSSTPSSSPSTYFTCPKGHGDSTSSASSSPIQESSSINQSADFTSQTPTTKSTVDDNGHATTSTHPIMNMSMSPNRFDNQTYASDSIITSMPTMINNNDGLKQQQEQIKP